ncbi:MAG TPA: glycyl-radical enzyme activating protein [Clostridia bacterium]|nr:glycyl-radical enzyme activating protein [Clostridia bacterium]
MVEGFISNIQHFSIGDGPGIRTTVFMQGCNLMCPWCHNPETIPREPVLMFFKSMCANCGHCVQLCKEDVHSIIDSLHVIDLQNCIHCGNCQKACNGSLKLSGKVMTLSEVFMNIYKDVSYFEESKGGVTISGGEPMLQSDFVEALSKMCKEKDIHVIIDTAGCVPFAEFLKVIPYTDTFYYDIKGDRYVYDNYVFGDYDLVISNLAKLITKGYDVRIRIPLIPQVNDSVEVMRTVYTTLKNLGVTKVSILPFHRLGSGKYDALNQEYGFKNTKELSKKKIVEIVDIFESIEVEIENH